MASTNEENMIVGLDIGTSKVVAIVGAIGANGDLEIVGTGMHVSSGLKKGVVVNIEATVNSIQRAVEEAELMAGCSIHSVYAGIAGSHIRSLNSHGIVAIRDREVQQLDVERVIDAARAVSHSRRPGNSPMCCPSNTLSTTRKGFTNLLVCRGCALKPRFT